MITIQIKIPSIRVTIDFRCNEKACVKDVIEDTLELVCREEQCEVLEKEQLRLCDVRHGCVLSRDRNLQDYHIQNGSCLALV